MKIIEAKNSKLTFTIGIVVSRFNEVITEALLQGAERRLQHYGFSNDQITIVKVPGAVEIPLALQRLARTKKYKALIALGSIIRGDTSHYQYVCDQVSQGCQRVMMQEDIPVIFEVLGTDNELQARIRAGGVHGNKGSDAVDIAVEIVSALEQI